MPSNLHYSEAAELVTHNLKKPPKIFILFLPHSPTLITSTVRHLSLHSSSAGRTLQLILSSLPVYHLKDLPTTIVLQLSKVSHDQVRSQDGLFLPPPLIYYYLVYEEGHLPLAHDVHHPPC